MINDENSNIYKAPEDRVNPQNVTSDDEKEFLSAKDNRKKEVLNDSIDFSKEVKDPALIEKQKRVNNLYFFLFLILIDAALLGYIIYLLVTIFISL